MDFVQLYTTTEGRINRKTWWLGVIGMIVMSLIVSVILKVFAGILGLTKSTFGQGLISLALIAILFVPYKALTLKRLHDRSRPEVLFWVFIAPSILSPLLMMLGLSGSTLDMSVLGQDVPMFKPNFLGSLVNLASLVIGIWGLVELGFLKGDQGDNAHGPNPSTATPAA